MANMKWQTVRKDGQLALMDNGKYKTMGNDIQWEVNGQ